MLSDGDSDGDAHQELHFILRQTQLMESVWTELKLGDGRAQSHPENRGWMNIFRRWTMSRTFRHYWPVLRAMYGLEFQRFCEDNLDLAGDKDCLQAAAWNTATPDDRTACELLLASDPLGRLQAARNPVATSTDLVFARLAGGRYPIVGFAAVRGGIGAEHELLALMTDRRFYFTGVSGWLRDQLTQRFQGATLFLRAPEGVQDTLNVQWRRMIRFYSRLGFSAREPERTGAQAIDEAARRILGPVDRYLYRRL